MPRAMLGGKHGAKVKKIDDIIMQELQRGPATVKEITLCIERRVRYKLDGMRRAGIVIREGRGGAYREYTYKLWNQDHGPGTEREDVRS
jgi:hypothetical protein